jgi:hypothetical protein
LIFLNDDRLFHFQLQQLTDNLRKNSQKTIQNLTRIKNHFHVEFSSFKINWNRQTRNSFDFSDKLKIAIRKSSETKSNCHGMKTFRQIKLFQLFFFEKFRSNFVRKFEGLKLWVMVQFGCLDWGAEKGKSWKLFWLTLNFEFGWKVLYNLWWERWSSG